MKKNLSLISFVLFLLAAASYLIMLFGMDKFLLAGVICSVVGLVIALFSESGIHKKIGLFGNGTFVVLTVIVPFFVTTFLWNTP
ncbi:hypothetical protein LCM10_03555 [Rossellomorea aquimaris]|uniref:hypothetical protein n=1 Tax=Rossellomorea aquimaris TaxID=189382 RepID=UPI001CD1C687|nr:hypothetical protein [Rossellomorea aquimaris]MCA1054053.1 hypothetical protein [Rossellomorea aquimaris]